jgi:LPS export ABC transporter protein LptC
VTLSGRELGIALLLSVVGLAAWWYRGSGSRDDSARPLPPGQPDYIVEQLTSVTMGEDGAPARRLRSPQLRHYPLGAGAELDTPVLHLLGTDEPDWVIRAERAWVAEGGGELLLEGRVVADRAAAPNAPALHIQTSELLVLDDAGYAETDRFVELEHGADWLTAIDGMQLWFREPTRSRFFGRVRQRMEMVEATEPPQGQAADGLAAPAPDAPSTSETSDAP